MMFGAKAVELEDADAEPGAEDEQDGPAVAIHWCSAMPRCFAASSCNARRAAGQPLPRSSNQSCSRDMRTR